MRHNPTLQCRNQEMYANYLELLRKGTPIMDIYAILSLRYGIDSDYLRRIIRNQARNH